MLSDSSPHLQEVDSILQLMRKQGYGLGHTEWLCKAKAYAAEKGVEGLDEVLHVSVQDEEPTRHWGEGEVVLFDERLCCLMRGSAAQ